MTKIADKLQPLHLPTKISSQNLPRHTQSSSCLPPLISTILKPTPPAMPHLTSPPNGSTSASTPDLVFPPVTKDHIQNCSYDSWFPKYRTSCLKSRIITLPPTFVTYLHEDGIILADDDDDNDDQDLHQEWHSTSATTSRVVEEVHSDNEEDDDDDDHPAPLPPNKRFPETHQQIKDKIAELGGAVAPKLNWSSPKDAKWISPHQNTLKCTTPNDIYLLLKSSSFVSHDLVHAFDDCTAPPSSRPFTPILVLRPFFNPHAALEFRCFVKNRCLIAISARDLNYYAFLPSLVPHLTYKIRSFFETTLRHTFPDHSFAFDVYVPESSSDNEGDKLGKVRLVDINPWAPRTDSLLFSWQELLEWHVSEPLLGPVPRGSDADAPISSSEAETDDDDEEDEDEDPEFRIVEKDDPAAFNFSSSQYSAHKLPKEVVDASMAGEGGIREFAQHWKEMTEGRGSGIWEKATGMAN